MYPIIRYFGLEIIIIVLASGKSMIIEFLDSWGNDGSLLGSRP